MSQRTNHDGKRKALQWTDSMDQTLLDALLHQVIKGNRVNGQFTTLAFDEVVEEVRTKTNNVLIDKDRVSNRMKTLKRNFAEAYDMFKGLSGFGWNPITKLFEAEEEVWKELIKTSPTANSWRKRPIAQYDKAKELWGKDRATGEHTTTAKEKARRWYMESELGQDITIEGIDNMVENSAAVLENFDLYSSYDFSQANLHGDDAIGVQHGVDDSNARTKKGGGSTSKKHKREDVVAAEIGEIKTVMERVMDVLADGNTIIEKANSIMERSRPRIYSSEEIYTDVACLDFDEDLKLEALELLVNNQAYARVFFRMPMEARKRWLLRKMSVGN